MLRRLGSLLLLTGAVVGAGVGAAILVGFRPVNLSWLMAIGLTKLALLASGGLMAAGAFCLRLEKRDSARRAMSLRDEGARLRE